MKKLLLAIIAALCVSHSAQAGAPYSRSPWGFAAGPSYIGTIKLQNGSQSAPSLTFWNGDTDVGIYYVTTNSLGLAASAGVYSNGIFLGPNGQAAGPTFTNTTGNTGMYFPTTTTLAWSTAGTKRLDMTASDFILASTMNLTLSGSGSNGWLIMTGLKHTAGSFNEDYESVVRKTWHAYVWTNAMIVAGGATTSADITIATLQAKTVITDAYVMVDTACTGTTTLTMSVGVTGATYNDLVVASDIQAAANTVYGDVPAEHGTGLQAGTTTATSRSGTTALKVQVISTGANLDAVLTCTGRVWLETAVLP